jgi:hypothetical protein
MLAIPPKDAQDVDILRGWPAKRTAIAVGNRNLQETAMEYCPWLRKKPKESPSHKGGGRSIFIHIGKNAYCFTGFAVQE